MTTNLLDQLQRALGTAYTLKSELGGGGMSRVFTAEETALGRTVVVKVLHPELAAGVNADRFNREVQLAARLQHPHIVPVLTAGQVDGLPYYTMPFVKGETLRARIARGPLPIPDVVHIMADVLRALAYAHAEGVVHRDIKPENVLLSGGAATVTDFGIAKALSSSRRDDGEALTQLGTSLGTVAYMAPEQVAGDPNLDHRADIYAVGCLAYELLTGTSPFAGKTPQQAMAAHVMEKPVPAGDKRPDAPLALTSIVMQCLEKEPSARPQSAEEILAALDNVTTGTTQALPLTPRRRSRVRALAIAGAALAAVAIAAVLIVPRFRTASAADDSLMLAVAPFEVLDPSLALWKEGIVDVLSRNLDGAGPIRTVSPSLAIKKGDGRIDAGSAAAFAERVDARLVVYGILQPAGAGMVKAQVSVFDRREGRRTADFEQTDSTARMDRLTDGLSLRLLSAIGLSGQSGSPRSLGTASLPAIRAFLQGQQYFRRTQWDSAAVAFEQAVSLDSNFAVGYMFLGQSLGWSRAGSAEGTRAYLRAGRLIRADLAPRDSLALEAVSHYVKAQQQGMIVQSEARQAVAAAQAAVDRYPNDAMTWYLLGDLRYHLEPKMPNSEALHYFDRAIAADSSFAPAYIHPIEISFRYGHQAARRYADPYLARDPRDLEEQGIRLAVRLSDPRTFSSGVPAALMDSITPEVAQKAFPAVGRLPDSAEAAILVLREFATRSSIPQGQRQQYLRQLAAQLAFRGHVKEAWARATDLGSGTAGEIAVLGLIPPDSAANAMRSWVRNPNDGALAAFGALAVARDTATLRGISRSMDSLAAAHREDSIIVRRNGIAYVAAAARAYLELARADTTAAIRQFDALPDSIFTVPQDQFVRARLVATRDPQRGLMLLGRRAPVGTITSVAWELERGRLAERLGDREQAVDAYAYVAAAWQNAHAEPLKNAVQASREALKRLDADGRMRAQLSSPR